MKGYFNPSLFTIVAAQCLAYENAHTSAAYFDPISTVDHWKEIPLGLLRLLGEAIMVQVQAAAACTVKMGLSLWHIVCHSSCR